VPRVRADGTIPAGTGPLATHEPAGALVMSPNVVSGRNRGDRPPDMIERLGPTEPIE